MKSKRELAYFGIGLAIFLLIFVIWIKGKEPMPDDGKNMPNNYNTDIRDNSDEISINEEMTADELESYDSEDDAEESADENTVNSDSEEVVIEESLKNSSETFSEEPIENLKENQANSDVIDNESSSNIIERVGEQLSPYESYRYKISIDVSDFKKSGNDLSEEDKDSIPANGYLLVSTNYEVVSQDTAISLLKKACRDYGIDLVLDDAENKVKSIGNIGSVVSDDAFLWKYSVNGEVENKNASEYTLKQGDILRWFYSEE